MSDPIRIPPHDLAAEQSVLASQMLADERFGASTVVPLIDRLPDMLTVGDFFSDIHAEIQKAIWAVREETGGNVDLILVKDRLIQSGSLEDVGGEQYLADILETVPHSAHVLHYAGIVSRCARRRKVIEIGKRMVERAYDPTFDDQEIVDDAYQTAAKMADSLHLQQSGPKKLSAITEDLIDGYSRGELPEVWWGIPEIVEELGGIPLGSLIVVGARPRHGKSMLALQWLDCAAREGITGLMISQEMMREQLANRTISYVCDIPKEDRKRKHDIIREEARAHFAERAPVYIADGCSKIARAEKAIRRAVRSHGVKLVAVDYAQIIDGDGDTEEQRISNVSKRMKQIALNQGVIVILLAQLNRQIEVREDPTPRLSDLKGSGGLEADADIVLFPYWPWVFDDSYQATTEYRIVIGKDRNGPGEGRVIEMRIDAHRQRLYPADPTRKFDNF